MKKKGKYTITTLKLKTTLKHRTINIKMETYPINVFYYLIVFHILKGIFYVFRLHVSYKLGY